MAVGKASSPPSVPRSMIVPFCQTRARLAPVGVRPMPITWPRSLIATVSLSAPSTVVFPFRQRTATGACFDDATVGSPTTSPRLLIAATSIHVLLPKVRRVRLPLRQTNAACFGLLPMSHVTCATTSPLSFIAIACRNAYRWPGSVPRSVTVQLEAAPLPLPAPVAHAADTAARTSAQRRMAEVLAADAEVRRHDRDLAAAVRAGCVGGVHGGDADLTPCGSHQVLAVLGAREPELQRSSRVDVRRRPEQVLADRPGVPPRG